MTFDNSFIGFEIGLVISPSKKAVEFDPATSDRPVIRVNFEFQHGSANLHPQPFFTGENSLVLKPGQADDVDISLLHVVAYMIVALDKNRGFLTSFKGFNLLLPGIASSVSGAAAGMLDFNDGADLVGASHYFNVRFNMADILQIIAVLMFGEHTDVAPNVEPGREPRFVVVTRDKVGRDSLSVRIVVYDILSLTINGSLKDTFAVYSMDVTVDNISSMKHGGNSFPFKNIVLRVKLV